MYKNGYFAEKDYDKYCSIIEKIYVRIRGSEADEYTAPDILTRIARIRKAQGKTKEAEAVEEESGLSVRFDDKWFRNVDDFFLKAEIDGERLPAIYYDLYDFRLV